LSSRVQCGFNIFILAGQDFGRVEVGRAEAELFVNTDFVPVLLVELQQMEKGPGAGGSW